MTLSCLSVSVLTLTMQHGGNYSIITRRWKRLILIVDLRLWSAEISQAKSGERVQVINVSGVMNREISDYPKSFFGPVTDWHGTYPTRRGNWYVTKGCIWYWKSLLSLSKHSTSHAIITWKIRSGPDRAVYGQLKEVLNPYIYPVK